jgi:uncharacterized protein
MSLIVRMEEDLKAAMLEHDNERRDALRLLLASLRSAEKEEQELAVLEEFMPAPLTEEELEEIVDDVIAEVGATSLGHLGRVMADVMPQVAGRADGSTVSQLVREKLA